MKALHSCAFLHYLFVVVLLVLPAEFYAQQFGITLYNINNGLPSTETYETYQDKYGYLWISTPAGLSRFDGRQFTNYSLTDGLPSLHVTKVFQDSRERIWVGTAFGMAQAKNNRFITFPTSDSLANFYVLNFIETKNKQIWAFTGKGAYEFRDSIWKRLAFYPGYENTMCRNAVELNGELYINYPHDIVCRTGDGKWQHIASSHNGSMFNVMSVYDNKIWINTDENIYEIRNHQLVPLYQKNLGIDYFFSYFVDFKKRLWLAGEELLGVSKPGDWHHFSEVNIEQYGYASSISEDLNHNIWVSTENGLLKVKEIAYTFIDKNKSALLNGISNIIALPGNRLIFSSGTKSGLLLYENDSCKQIPPLTDSEYYYQDLVDAYAFDDKNSLWMITRFKKFLHFNGKALEDFSGTLHFKTREIAYDVAYAKSRHQFFICADSTLLYGNSSRLSTFIPGNTGIPVMKPTRVREIKNGLLLVFIEGKGIYCIDPDNNLVSLNKGSGLDASKGLQSAACFCEAADNNFWMAVPGMGLYEYGFAKDKLPFLKNHFTLNDGLQSNNILSLTMDRQSRLWVASNTGIDILQKKEAGGWEIFNYATTDELTFNGSNYDKLVTDTAGNIWFSSPDKIFKFNAAAIKLYKAPPRIVIEKVSLLFKETDWSKLSDSLYGYYQLPYNPVLHYNQNSLGVSFNAIDLSTTNSAPEYAYKLLPLDTSWSIPSKIKSVSFAQLPAGEYQFVVRAKEKASGWSNPAVFKFTIVPPFWNEWWFRSIIIAIASFIIISIFRGRVRKIKHDAFVENQLKELEMKALKAQMNPHFIYNALNSIQALIANDKKTEGIRYIGSFSRLLRQVLDNSDNNVISLDKELETIGLYIQLESLRLDMQLQFQKNIPNNIVAEFEKIPPLILQPFVENALWHGLSRKTGEKKVAITISAKDDWLLCEITDNGIGRAKASEYKSQSVVLHQSKGLDITRKRLIDFNNDNSVAPIEFFDVHDAEKNTAGTRVAVRIKRKLSLPAA